MPPGAGMAPGRLGLIAHGSTSGIEPPGVPRGRRPVWDFFAGAGLALKTFEKGVGKAWISLDSLVRNETYQWVTRDFREKISRCPLAPWGRRSGATEGGPRAHAEGQKCPSRKRNSDSDFLQSIVASASQQILL